MLTQEVNKVYTAKSRRITMTTGRLLLQCLLTAVVLHSQPVTGETKFNPLLLHGS